MAKKNLIVGEKKKIMKKESDYEKRNLLTGYSIFLYFLLFLLFNLTYLSLV